MRPSQELINALDAANKTEAEQSPALQIVDLYLAYNHLFTPAAKRGMAATAMQSTSNPRKVKAVFTTNNQVVMDPVRFAGSTAIGEENIIKAAHKVAEVVNKLAEQGFVTASLLKLGALQLVTEPHELPKYLVVSYFALTAFGAEQYELMKPDEFCEEGGLPKSVCK